MTKGAVAASAARAATKPAAIRGPDESGPIGRSSTHRILPWLRTERIDPVDENDRTQPADPTDKTDPADPSERTEPADPTDRIDPTEEADWIEAVLKILDLLK